MEGPQPGMGLSLTWPGVFQGPPILGSDLGLPKGHPVSEGAVFKELKRKKGIERNQGRLPGGRDGERVWHMEGAEKQSCNGLRNCRLPEDRGGICLLRTAPTLQRDSGTRYQRRVRMRGLDWREGGRTDVPNGEDD